MKNNENDYTTRFLLWQGSGLIVIAFLYIFGITFVKIPDESQKHADIILGFLLGTLVSTIIQFYYGSSVTSKSKGTPSDNLSDKIDELEDKTNEISEDPS